MTGALFAQQPNFIFIIADDLNDYVGVLGGHPQIETPHIDSLAARGVTFINTFCSAPGCAPSRTSMLSGKDLYYTNLYTNANYLNDFRLNFTEENDNAVVFTIPEIMKDSGNYYTYGLGKIFHSPHQNDYDEATDEACEKGLSWNRMHCISADESFLEEAEEYAMDTMFDFGVIPDDLEAEMQDHIVADSAIAFIHGFANNTINTCGNPFFLTLGIRKPHVDRFIPEAYYQLPFQQDLYADSFSIIYNNPPDITPYNGIVLPPQPELMYGDFLALPPDGIGHRFAEQNEIYEMLLDYVDAMPWLPEIDPTLTDAERTAILYETMKANYVSAYIAAVQFADSMVGKVMDALYQHPELAENTIVIFTSDHGYALGEKQHYTKWALWETDIRVPLIISHPSFAQNAICKSVTSLLDIFPTVCDLAGIAHPVFPDGEKYLDGHSLAKYLFNPGMNSAHVALTSYKPNNGIGSCFPHYSLRTERFHYIRYRVDNENPEILTGCDPGSENYEEELYDIGQDRQTDPNEWNNLASDPDYAALLEYLREYMPGGALYTEQPYMVNIYTNSLPCFANYDDIIQMRALLINTDGFAADTLTESAYTYTWTNNITNDIFSGSELDFHINSLPLEAFNEHEKLLFYLHVHRIEDGSLVAFRIKEILLHDELAPDVHFSAVINDHTLNITGLEILGSVQNIVWDFGDGTTVTAPHPGAHIYAAPGIYSLNMKATFGNKCTLEETTLIDVPGPELTEPELFRIVDIFPNPAHDYIHVETEKYLIMEGGMLLNIAGEVVYAFTGETTTIAVPQLAPGIYLLRLNYAEGAVSKPVEIF